MKFNGNKAEEVKIAYIGGGSRGWAWGLMSDLAVTADMSGDVYLYDIDFEAAKNNEIIGNKYNGVEGVKSHWDYHAVKTIDEALSGANFVVISILPGTFDEMESDVHAPEKYGIYQSVGDTAGPGGIIRALRTLPMMEEIAKAIEKNCPEAWVINYTNPMTLCVKALYDTFPKIKAFGCCHEVFSTQTMLMNILKEFEDIDVENRNEIKVNVLSVNHFTWLNNLRYRDMDLMPLYAKFCEKYSEIGYDTSGKENWLNRFFYCSHKVKMDLFKRYGVVAAAGDRHLAEFCEGKWYLENPEEVQKWGFGLTPVSWRKEDLQRRLDRSAKLISGEEELKLNETGEEGVTQMRAILGLCDLVTNVNLPNMGQIPNLPIGAVVETNAVFRSDSVTPVFAGSIPESIYPLISRVSGEQEIVAKAIRERNLELAFQAFANDPLVTIPVKEARKLFKEMIENTKAYLGMYDVDGFKA
ncbi:MAG: alpha-glucosidase/alpha-galactosidase [Clostridia bacterium]|nr:alpha-glucosidase/alpha-galactosidase [Clostridia bacterium]